jgi:ABC-2 type transport system ATP-binding protein
MFSKMLEHLRRTPFWALRDVSLRVRRGDIVGIIGANGSGKSTLLRVLAGITPPTRGQVRVQGRVASLLELGVGFHPDLTGMENIFYNAAMHGLKRDEVLERLETIIQFSGLRDYLYEPVKHYSSGMYARLGCSVALHLDPDIALVDEILSVGDAEFRDRVHARLRALIDQGVTVFLVTHEVATAANLCGELIWLDDGRVRCAGEPATVRRAYERDLRRRSLPGDHVLARELAHLQDGEYDEGGEAGRGQPSVGRMGWSGPGSPGTGLSEGDGAGAVESVVVLDEEERVAEEVITGREVHVRVTGRARRRLDAVSLRVLVWAPDARVLADHVSPPRILPEGERGEWTLRWTPALWLDQGAPIYVSVALVNPSEPDRALSAGFPPIALTVHSPAFHTREIPCFLPYRWRLETGDGQDAKSSRET